MFGGGATAIGCTGIDDIAVLSIELVVVHAATNVIAEMMASAVTIFDMVHTPSC
jgi:hypothetical protein